MIAFLIALLGAVLMALWWVRIGDPALRRKAWQMVRRQRACVRLADALWWRQN
jgi:hypothetical protein